MRSQSVNVDLHSKGIMLPLGNLTIVWSFVMLTEIPESVPFLQWMDERAKETFAMQYWNTPAQKRAAFLATANTIFTKPPGFGLADYVEECARKHPTAKRWKVVLEGYAYYTCEHPDPHIELV